METECDRLVKITDNLIVKTTTALKEATEENIKSKERRKIESLSQISHFNILFYKKLFTVSRESKAISFLAIIETNIQYTKGLKLKKGENNF